MKTIMIKLEVKPSEIELLRQLYTNSIEQSSRTGEPKDKVNRNVYKAINKALNS